MPIKVSFFVAGNEAQGERHIRLLAPLASSSTATPSPASAALPLTSTAPPHDLNPALVTGLQIVGDGVAAPQQRIVGMSVS
jgi:hypothetical protein